MAFKPDQTPKKKAPEGEKAEQEKVRKNAISATAMMGALAIGASPVVHDNLIPSKEGEGLQDFVANTIQSGIDILEGNQADLKKQGIAQKEDGTITITLQKPNPEQKTANSTVEYPRTVASSTLAGKPVSGHFMDTLNLSTTVIPDTISVDPVAAFQKLIARKKAFVERSNTALESPETIDRELEELKEQVKAGSLQTYESVESFIGTMQSHIRDFFRFLPYENLRTEYNLTPEGLDTLKKVLQRVDAEMLLSYYITELYGSDNTEAGAAFSRDMFAFVLTHYGLEFIQRSYSVNDRFISRGLGHSTLYVFQPNSSVSRVNKYLPAAFQVGNDITKLNEWHQQVTVSLCITIDEIARIIKTAQDSSSELNYIESQLKGDLLAALLGTLNHAPGIARPAFLNKMNADLSGRDIAFEQAISNQKNEPADTLERVRSYAKRTVNVRLAMENKFTTTQGTALANEGSERPDIP